MRQVVLQGPGRLSVEAVSDPQPDRGEVVLEVLAALTCGTDLKVLARGGHPRMLVAPSPFGHELCGRVRRVGEGVVGWSVGDTVAVANSAPCGACPQCRGGRDNLCLELEYLNGAFAEQLLVPARFVERSLVALPPAIAPEIVALAEPLACVRHGMQVLRPVAGETIAVIGCGPIGLLFVAELAVAGVDAVAFDPHPARLEVAAGFGATRLERVVERGELSSSGRLDAVVEATGSPTAWAATLGLLAPGSRALFFGGVPPGHNLVVDAVRLHYQELALLGAYHYTRAAFAEAVARLHVAGERLRPLLSYECSLDEVPEAFTAMRERRALKVVVRPRSVRR